jgi:hypothetical protein
MKKIEHLTVYVPEELRASDGLLLGYNFQAVYFVVTSVVPWSKLKSMDHLNAILKDSRI